MPLGTMLGLTLLLLLVSLKNPSVTFDERAKWWSKLASLAVQLDPDIPFIACADANATCGHDVSIHVGSHRSNRTNINPHALLSFFSTCNLFAPSTFAHKFSTVAALQLIPLRLVFPEELAMF